MRWALPFRRVKVEVAELKEASVVEVRASGTVHLARFDGAAKSLGEVRSWSGAGEKPEALRLSSQALGWQTFDALLPGLMAHAAIQATLKGADRIAAGKLSAAKVASAGELARSTRRRQRGLARRARGQPRAGARRRLAGAGRGRARLGRPALVSLGRSR